MASLWKQLSEDMERVAQVVEDGAKFMMGETDHMGDATSDSRTPNSVEYDGDNEDANLDSMADIADSYGSPLMGMADSVMSDIMSNQVGPQTSKEHIQAFAAAIRWTEPFIQSVIAFHVLVIVLAVAVSRKGSLYGRMGLMLVVGIIVRLAERLNAMGASRWREFSTQNYFDKNGIFMGIMVCAPLLLVCLLMLVSIIWEAQQMLLDVKKMKINKQTKQKQKKKKDQTKKKDGAKRKKKD